MTWTQQSRARGPQRPAGAPVGPQQVRRAVLDAAARLFAERGVDAVSLRDIATQADVHLALIGRYIGNREAVVLAVFDHLSERLAEAVVDNPLSGQGFTPDTVMGQWVRVTAALASRAGCRRGRGTFNPVRAMAKTLADGYGLDELSAHVRAAQIVAAALGWRIFEDYLVDAGTSAASRCRICGRISRTVPAGWERRRGRRRPIRRREAGNGDADDRTTGHPPWN